jgi:creatinine amidohydrolase
MREHPSLSILRARVAQLPEVIDRAIHTPLPGTDAQRAHFCAMRRFVVTGGGLSEGPARVLVALLRRQGRDAQFEPQTAFTVERAPAPDTALVLFSQGLAPNARLPLSSMRAGCGASLLITSVVPGEGAMGKHAQSLLERDRLVWTLPPASENGLLLRVLGPAVALTAALRIAAMCAGEQIELSSLDVPRHLRASAPDLFFGQRRPIAIVADPSFLELAMPLRWKLLEGLRVPDPPVWDVLQVAHGPLQSFYDHPTTFVTLRGPRPSPYDDLFASLRSVLRDHHALVELRASSTEPVALLELDAMLNAALLTTLAANPLPLDDWPSRGLDGPLYDVTTSDEEA